MTSLHPIERPRPRAVALCIALSLPAHAVPDTCDGGGALPATLNLSGVDATATGDAAGAFAGASVAMGDLNGDGIGDVAVGVPGSPQLGSGVLVWFGPFDDLATQALPAPDVALRGGTSLQAAGSSLHIADLTGDGLPDLTVGSRGDPVYVLAGGSSWPSSSLISNLAVAQLPAFNGPVQFTSADLDDDGNTDLVVGAPRNNGAIEIFLGPLIGNESSYARIGGPPSGELGAAVATMDATGDGIADIIVGAPGSQNGRGAIAVIPGGSLPSGTLPLSAAPIVLLGAQNARAGTSLATWQDWLYIGAPGTNNGAGAVHGLRQADILATGTGPISAVPGEVWPGGGGDGAGAAVAVGSVRGTATPQLLIGCPNDNAGNGIVLVHNAIVGGTLNRASTIRGVSGARLGSSLAVYDVDRDTYADILIGGPGYLNDQGIAYWHQGGGDLYDEVVGYPDADADGFGVLGVTAQICPNETGTGFSPLSTDCDDTRDDVFPGAPERCDEAIDFDCNGLASNVDGDGDSLEACRDCNDDDPTISSLAPELCNGIDDDCDELVDESATDATVWFADADADGFGNDGLSITACEAPIPGATSVSGDCDDEDPSAYPGAQELCDNADQDCDGAIDNDPVDGNSYYADVDLDGAGDPTQVVSGCSAPAGYVRAPTDCDDADAMVRPGSFEICDGIDNDCNGLRHLGGEVDLDLHASSWTGGTGDFGATSLIADINNDGIPDLAVANPRGDGEVAIRFGPLDDRRVRGTADADIVLRGTTRDEAFGTAITTGDINGDGILDLIVGGPGHRAPGLNHGAVSIFAGPIRSERPATALITGRNAGDRVGTAILAADLDQSGRDQLIIGANALDGSGRVYVVANPAGGTISPSASLQAPQDVRLGTSLALGDLDGDGTLDLIAGAPGLGSLDQGGALITYDIADRSGPFPADAGVAGILTGGNIGVHLATADMDQDGADDLWLSSGRGEAWLVSGADLVPGIADLDETVFMRWSGATGARFGAILTGVGDLDGDGHRDVLLGATSEDDGASNAGAAYVVYSDATLASRWGALLSSHDIVSRRDRSPSQTAGAHIPGNAANMGLGQGLGSGDANLDGFDDIVIASTVAGEVYVMFGGPEGTDTLANCDTDADGCIDDVDAYVSSADLDTDTDGIGDSCDLCVGTDATGDPDFDGICSDLDICPGFDDFVDADGNGDIDCVDPSIELDIGRAHGCAVGKSDRMECWGSNDVGQAPIWSPILIDEVATGDDFTCAILAGGAIACVGDNSQGQAPAAIPSTAIGITAGGAHACALTADADVVCWGDDTHGQAPATWVGPFLDVQAGGEHTCVLTPLGDVECRGRDHLGQAPALTAGPWVAVTTGNAHTCALAPDGVASCWGDDRAGQSSVPNGRFTALSAGYRHTCGTGPSARLTCWGENGAAAPHPSVASAGFTDIAAGNGATCGVVDGVRGVCWTVGGALLSLDLELCYGDESLGDADNDGLCADFDDDNDGDGIPDTVELQFGSDPDLADTDGDGLDDGEEVAAGTSPLSADTDNDGLDDPTELAGPTSPTDPDVDGDGLLDGEEVAAGTDPFNPDTDADGLQDGPEVQQGLDPLSADTDGDGLDDLSEVIGGTDPRLADTDRDGIDDPNELLIGTDPTQPDSDGDGLGDGAELSFNADPLDPDTDDDGLFDGAEIRNGADPLDPDTDTDGLGDFQEVNTYGTDPGDADTDNDGVSDGDEVLAGSDPNDGNGDTSDEAPDSGMFTGNDSSSPGDTGNQPGDTGDFQPDTDNADSAQGDTDPAETDQADTDASDTDTTDTDTALSIDTADTDMSNTDQADTDTALVIDTADTDMSDTDQADTDTALVIDTADTDMSDTDQADTDTALVIDTADTDMSDTDQADTDTADTDTALVVDTSDSGD